MRAPSGSSTPAQCPGLPYPTEAALVQDFAVSIRHSMGPWGPLKVKAEFEYAVGRADLIALTWQDELLAFEAKLTRWRDALHQAFRSTFFASRSYVVLPPNTAQRAVRYAPEFLRRNVGLCAAVDGVVRILLLAPPVSTPLQPWLAAQAVAMIRGGDEHTT